MAKVKITLDKPANLRKIQMIGTWRMVNKCRVDSWLFGPICKLRRREIKEQDLPVYEIELTTWIINKIW